MSRKGYEKKYLVSDINHFGKYTDTNLVNAWGMIVKHDTIMDC